MKIKFLMAGLLGLISTAALAQKSELANAQTEYESYSVTSASAQKIPMLKAKAKTSLNNAKTSIDKAAANTKTATLPLTYAVKSTVYAALAEEDSVETTSSVNYNTASEALKQAKLADTKNENTKLINEATIRLERYQLNKGVNAYQNKKYVDAYKSFDSYRMLSPEDTTAIFYTALAATNAGSTDPKYYQYAISNYNKLVTTKYSKNPQAYLDMSAIYLHVKDTVGALKAVNEGVTKYPKDSELRKRQIEIALQTGKQNDIISSVETAIANDPKNKTLYYYSGLTYSQIADADFANLGKIKDAAAKAAMHQKILDNYNKAGEMYKKAIEIDPNYFEANLNLGYVLMRPAIDTYNAANSLPANKQKEYEQQIAKAGAQFDVAKPYLQKAVELNPKSVDALTNMMNYYRGKKDNANAAKIKTQIDALK
ncbi:MAG TPA: tetratricopeptide repeat protein [Mucilaginibacter sp.]|jgi:hypothetical protein|nr:tetratricopeptide repeat protein [Mucilaginibacter sp.]